jgi:hypothetical protein
MSSAPVVFSRELFAPTVGSEYQLRAPDGRSMAIVLTKLTDRGGGLHTTQFSLLFEVPDGGPTEQDVYTVEQETIGSVDLLLVPVSRVQDGVLFEAAFALLSGQPPVKGEAS